MPQLDTVYIFMIYLWTWFMLYLIMQKIKTIPIMKTPKLTPLKTPKDQTPLMPWT